MNLYKEVQIMAEIAQYTIDVNVSAREFVSALPSDSLDRVVESGDRFVAVHQGLVDSYKRLVKLREDAKENADIPKNIVNGLEYAGHEVATFVNTIISLYIPSIGEVDTSHLPDIVMNIKKGWNNL